MHVSSPSLNFHAAAPIARRRRIPLVYEMRATWEDAAVDSGLYADGGLYYRLSRTLETLALRRADAVTTICEGLRGEILDRGVPADRITVIPNAVDVDRLPYDREPNGALQAELGLHGDQTIGYIGSFYRYEGLHLLIEAMPRILERAPQARLLLVGGGFEEANLRRQAAPLGDAVVFTGLVPNPMIVDYYSLCRVMVYPRVDIRLTRIVTPLKALEAMAQGRAVVASDVGGHRELIRDGETGRLFRAGDVEALAAVVVEQLSRSDQREAQRRAARAFVENERTWAHSAARYKPLFESLTTS